MDTPVAPGPAKVARDTGGLLERLQFVTDVEDACHVVLEAVLRAGGPERAAVVLCHDEDMRSVGYGIADERLRAFCTASDGRVLRDIIASGEDRVVDDDEVSGGLGLEAYRILPFPDPRGAPAGALLLDVEEGAEPDPAVLAGLRRAGPTLARIHVREIQDRRLERVESRNELLGAVVDSLSDPVVLTDHQNNFLFANRRAEELFHAAPAESEGRRRAIRINDLLFSSFLTQSVISGGEPVSRELNLVDPMDGSDLLFEVLSLPIPPGLSQESAVISVLRDITDLKRALTELEVQFNRSRVAEQQARRESDRLNVIIGSVGDPILVTDEDSKIILMNAEAERLFEPEQIDDSDQPSRRAVRANDTKFTTLISDFLLQDNTRRVENLILTDPADGEELPVEVVSSKIPGPRGEVSAIVSIIHDLTQVVENERLARELQILNEGLEDRIRLATEELEERNRRLEWQSRELQKASRLKSEFLASMSHELRTPINAMLGYTALLREEIYGSLNDKQVSALKKIYGSSQHLLALINDILDLSKIEAGRMPVRIEEVRIDAVVSELAQTMEPMLREKGLDYRSQLADDLPVMKTDRTKVKQILLNLLSNAVKFTAEGSIEVRATTGQDGDTVVVEVEDTGIGIERGEIEAIFDDFRQLDQSSTRRFGGTGLGLSITRKLVALMNGSIGVESLPDVGSTFRVELPVVLSPDEVESDEEGRGSIEVEDIDPDLS